MTTEAVPYLGKNRPWEKEQPRSPLAARLPLDTPFSIQIDPSSLCNFRCRFCPTGHPELLQSVGRGKGQLMAWSLYERLIDGIAEFPRPLKTLSLHKDGEPLLNPRLADMVSLAKKRAAAGKIITLTNASLLTRERSIGLIESGLDVIRISVEQVSDEGYRLQTGTFGDYGRVVDNVRALREERDRRGSPLFIAAKLIDLGLAPPELEAFARDFAPHCDEIGRTTAQGWSHSDLFDFTLGTRPAVSLDGRTALKPGRVACPFPFYMLAVNASGVVSPCTDDWTHKAAVGDANSESLRAIWDGPRLRSFRLMHLSGNRGRNAACGPCHCVQGIPEDSDLDADRERLAGIFEGGA